MKFVSIGLSKSKSFVSKTIRFFGKLQTGDARYSHSFMILDDKFILEEGFFGLRVRPIKKYLDQQVLVYRPKFLSQKASDRVKEEALKQVGTYKGIYGYAKIPLFALDSVFKTYWFTKHIGVKHFKVCSQFCAYLFYKYADYDEFKNWRSLSPDGLDDFMRKKTIDWYPTHELT